MRPSRKCLHSVQRIISIPITRPTSAKLTTVPLRTLDHSKILTYYHFQINNPNKKPKTNSRWAPEGGWTSWLQGKASSTWSSFGKAPEGTWKLKVFQTGERIIDRVDFEELSLKGVDPSLGPTILHPDFSGKGREKKAKEGVTPVKPVIPLLYPSSLYSSEGSLEHLRQLLSTRQPRHKRGFWIWIAVMPLTAPFMLIPVIPNLPFFFCVWRSWSHYRAYRASQYLSTLIENEAIVPEPSDVLEDIYRGCTPKVIPASSAPSTPNDDQSAAAVELLLSKDAVPEVVSSFELTKSATADIYRAIEQANTRFSKTS